ENYKRDTDKYAGAKQTDTSDLIARCELPRQSKSVTPAAVLAFPRGIWSLSCPAPPRPLEAGVQERQVLSTSHRSVAFTTADDFRLRSAVCCGMSRHRALRLRRFDYNRL